MENKITQAQFIGCVGMRSNHADKVVSEVLKAAAVEILEFAELGIGVPFPGIGRAGLGTFHPHDAPERMGRNPKTGETHRIPAKRVLKFNVSPTVDLNK